MFFARAAYVGNAVAKMTLTSGGERAACCVPPL
jgi:hypothetical protein